MIAFNGSLNPVKLNAQIKIKQQAENTKRNFSTGKAMEKLEPLAQPIGM